MGESLSPIDRLRQLAAALERVPATAWFVDAVRRYEAEAANGMTLDRALGLATLPGQPSWWEAEARQRRDAAIRELRDQHFAELGVSVAAREIAKRGRRLQGSAWQQGERPRDVVDQLLAEALGTGAPFPKQRRIEDILRKE